MMLHPMLALSILLFTIAFCGISASCCDARRVIAFFAVFAVASALGFAAFALASGQAGGLACAVLALAVGGAHVLVGLGLLRSQPPQDAAPDEGEAPAWKP